MKSWKLILISFWLILPALVMIDTVFIGYQDYKTYFVLCLVEATMFTIGFFSGRKSKEVEKK